MIRAALVFVLVSCVSVASARAQEPPPRIPLFVVDVQGNVARFPQDPELASSRGIEIIQLPGTGFGGQLGLHLHFFKVKAVTFGLGGQVTLARATESAPVDVNGQPLAPTTERFRSVGVQLSLNFGNGNGWSYLSGGIGRSNWSIIPEFRADNPTVPAEPLEGDDEVLKTINYGGGARWFAKSHLAFSFDVRFYAINPGVSSLPGKNGSPRTTFMVIGAGISLK
jgi:hypothetical protein